MTKLAKYNKRYNNFNKKKRNLTSNLNLTVFLNPNLQPTWKEIIQWANIKNTHTESKLYKIQINKNNHKAQIKIINFIREWALILLFKNL